MSDVERVAEVGALVLDEIERAVIGKRDALELILLALLADGHVLIEDVPGLAKTLMARSFATVCGLDFARIQFTPDLMPSDVTGTSVLDPVRSTLEFRPGPVFTQLLLADEINRAPAKTQAALLEAMGERQVSVEGETRPLRRPFLVVATQNPIEYEGTYPLPEAQLDRFLVRVSVGYPKAGDEREMLLRRARRGRDDVDLVRRCDAETLLALQAAVETVHVSEALADYVVGVVDATRSSPQVEVGASPRGALALLKLGRARAALERRTFVIPDDVKAVAVPALSHRLLLTPDAWVQQLDAQDVIRRVLTEVPVPVDEPA